MPDSPSHRHETCGDVELGGADSNPQLHGPEPGVLPIELPPIEHETRSVAEPMGNDLSSARACAALRLLN